MIAISDPSGSSPSARVDLSTAMIRGRIGNRVENCLQASSMPAMGTQAPVTAVESVEILTVIDNVVDLLLPSTEVVKRIGPSGPEG